MHSWLVIGKMIRLMFIGKSGVTYGYKNTLANYKKNYPDTATMGKLTFTLIQVKQLSPEYFHVTGKYYLNPNNWRCKRAFYAYVQKNKWQMGYHF
jgi:hypothetical protein